MENSFMILKTGSLKKLALDHTDKNERILLADLTASHNTCFCILQNGLKILIAACNTFKSGAIEQLRVYVALGQNSNVDIWKRCKGLLLITPKQTNLMY
ncbi:unnamed protein product [Rhizophagus irregularis]|nr:unnamed protein product [Rhizophagus irregularis]